MVKRHIMKRHTVMNRGHEKSSYVGGSTYFTLSCGHVTTRKNSSCRNINMSTMLACAECLRLSQGVVVTEDNRDGTVTVHTWDAKKKMPAVTKRARAPNEFESVYRNGHGRIF